MNLKLDHSLEWESKTGQEELGEIDNGLQSECNRAI